jgi:hypothetical protein
VNGKIADFCGQDCFGNFAALLYVYKETAPSYRYKEQKAVKCSRRQEKQ